NLIDDQISSSSAEQQGRGGKPETGRNEASGPLPEESRRVFERQGIRRETVQREGEGDAPYEDVHQNEQGLLHARHLTGPTGWQTPSHHRLTNDSLPVGWVATSYVAEIDLVVLPGKSRPCFDEVVETSNGRPLLCKGANMKHLRTQPFLEALQPERICSGYRLSSPYL